MRKIEDSTDTPTEFELGDTAADILGVGGEGTEGEGGGRERTEGEMGAETPQATTSQTEEAVAKPHQKEGPQQSSGFK